MHMINMAAFLSFIFITTFTPGPNNIMAMTSAGKYGIKRGFRFCLGMFIGFLMVMASCAAFSAMLLKYIPKIEPVMLYISAAYILWLAWSVYRDASHGDGAQYLDGNILFSGIFLQFINAKGILFGITAMSTFILPYYRNISVIAIFVFVLTLTGFAGTCCWAAFGALFQKIFNSRYRKALNSAMALSLAYCAVSSLIKR